MTPQQIHSLSEIAHHYDGIILDQFGVIHDGESPYNHALATLEAVKAATIPVILVSNSGASTQSNTDRLINIGFKRDYFLSVITSGEISRSFVAGKKVFLICKSGKHYTLPGASIVESPAHSEIILVLGNNYPETSIADYQSLLDDVDVPMLCANPDFYNISPSGLTPGPGQIAKLFEEAGGDVTWIGKPFPLIYHHALDQFVNKKRILCIGDSLDHDIKGGLTMGFDTLLVRSGVSETIDIVHSLIKPNYVMDRFIW